MSTLNLAQAKSWLNITTTDHDADLQTVIDAAEAAIEEQVGPLAVTTVTQRIPGGYGTLSLPVTPAVALTSVTPYGGTALTLGDLYLDTTTGMVSFNAGADFTGTYYTVVYTAGRNPVPADLLLAVKELVSHLWETRRGPTRRPGSGEPTVIGASYALPRRVEQLIAPHSQRIVSGFA